MAKSSGNVKKIDTNYFEATIQALDDAIGVYEDAKGNVDSATKKLQNTWNGKGAKKFDSAYKRLKKELDDQGENLVAMRDSLQVILETYQEWDRENANLLAGETEEG